MEGVSIVDIRDKAGIGRAQSEHAPRLNQTVRRDREGEQVRIHQRRDVAQAKRTKDQYSQNDELCQHQSGGREAEAQT